MLLLFCLSTALAINVPLTVPSIVECGSKISVTWPDIVDGCDSLVDDIEGVEYYPTIVFSIDKKLPSGDKITVGHAEFLSRCNIDGVDGSMNAYTWNVPSELNGDWAKQGGSANEALKTFSLSAYFLTPQETLFTSADFSFGDTCTFKSSSLSTVCSSNCFGPTADCSTGTCTCKGGYKLMNGSCQLESPVMMMTGASPNQDCQYSPWKDYTSCSSLCGSGMKKRRRLIVSTETGTGKKCDVMNCPEDPLDNCLEEEVACVGRDTNAECPPESEVSGKEGCFGCACRGAAPECDDAFQCVSGTCWHAPAGTQGCENCSCRVSGQKCDGFLVCNEQSKCVPKPKGCVGCSCLPNNMCDAGLVCNTAQLCARPPRLACTAGTERCECMGTTCASDALECVDGICAAKGVVPIQTNPPAGACAKHRDCTSCRESIQTDGVGCSVNLANRLRSAPTVRSLLQWCKLNTGSANNGACVLSAVLECPQGYTLQNVLSFCPVIVPPPTPAPVPPQSVFTGSQKHVLNGTLFLLSLAIAQLY